MCPPSFILSPNPQSRAKNSIELDGKNYPLLTFDVSSSSHPFYTGQQRLLDTEGRAEKFRKKYAKIRKNPEAPKKAPPQSQKA